MRSARALLSGFGMLVATSLAIAAPAHGATVLGSTFLPADGCSPGATFLQTGSPGNFYAAPSAGVITGWSFQAGPNPPSLKFKLARPAGGTAYQIVGESGLTSPAPNQTTTIPAQIPAQAGDVIGFFVSVMGKCGTNAGPETFSAFLGDPPVGATANFSVGTVSALDVSASFEPDADADGFGDETQDQCPTDPAAQGPCPPPVETSIKKGPDKKTDKRTVKFTFSATVAGSTFQCKLKGHGLDSAIKQFTPCHSPRKYRDLDKGKYKFFVVATAPNGIPDATAATQKFKITG